MMISGSWGKSPNARNSTDLWEKEGGGWREEGMVGKDRVRGVRGRKGGVAMMVSGSWGKPPVARNSTDLWEKGRGWEEGRVRREKAAS